MRKPFCSKQGALNCRIFLLLDALHLIEFYQSKSEIVPRTANFPLCISSYFSIYLILLSEYKLFKINNADQAH